MKRISGQIDRVNSKPEISKLIVLKDWSNFKNQFNRPNTDSWLKTAEPLKTIDPKLSTDGKTFTFNQFGFVIKDTDPVELNFSMICTLKFGTAPTDCTGSARRQINPRQFGTQNQDKDFHYLESNLDGKIKYPQ